MLKTLTLHDISQHATSTDCWIAIHKTVYDITLFLNQHPGGMAVLLDVAGSDATRTFDKIHSKDLLNLLKPEWIVGICHEQLETKDIQSVAKSVPSISSMLNTFDFEVCSVYLTKAVAKEILSPEAWAYFSSGADDEITLQENQVAFQRIYLKPRVLVNVKHIDCSTTMFEATCTLPLYVSATALGKLGHQEGEVILTRAAGTRNVVQMISTLASCSLSDLVNARIPGQVQWFQLYVNSGNCRF